MSLNIGDPYVHQCRDQPSTGLQGRKRELLGLMCGSGTAYHPYLNPTSHWEPPQVFLQEHNVLPMYWLRHFSVDEQNSSSNGMETLARR